MRQPSSGLTWGRDPSQVTISNGPVGSPASTRARLGGAALEQPRDRRTAVLSCTDEAPSGSRDVVRDSRTIQRSWAAEALQAAVERLEAGKRSTPLRKPRTTCPAKQSRVIRRGTCAAEASSVHSRRRKAQESFKVRPNRASPTALTPQRTSPEVTERPRVGMLVPVRRFATSRMPVFVVGFHGVVPLAA